MSAAVISAAGLAAAAAWVGVRPGGGRLLLRRLGGGRLASGGRLGLGEHGSWVPAAAASAVVCLAGGGPVLALAVPVLVGSLSRLRRTAARDARAAVERLRVREFAELLAAELRAGRPAAGALAGAARDLAPPPAWAASVAAAGDSGAEILEALTAAATRPGAEGLREVAACWRVGERAGAGLAAGVAQLAVGLREREAHRAHLAAQLAGVRACGYLLAGLPFFGLLLGSGLGARPWHVLLATPAGNAALAGGLALDVAGVAWLAALARSAEAAG